MSSTAPTSELCASTDGRADLPAPRVASSVDLLAFMAALGLLWVILCRALSYIWAYNETYSYGWFVPFFTGYIFWLRWQDRPRRESPPRAELHRWWILTALLGLAVLLPVRLVEVANPDWRSLGWVHAIAVVSLTLLVIWRAGGKSWLTYFSFPVLFFLIAVPWISRLEVPVVHGLMYVVAHAAAESLVLLGIPTHVEGSLIRVSSGLVGVNEACSGVRSLQTALMIGLLFGELKHLSTSRRIALVSGAVMIALLGNVGRTCFLVWLAATQNTEATSGWHDIAGYSIVGAVFIGTMALAYWLGRTAGSLPRRVDGAVPNNSFPIAPARGTRDRAGLPFRRTAAVGVLCWLVLIELGVESWYRLHEQRARAVTRWTEAWPEQAPGFHTVVMPDELQRTLRCDRGREAVWSEPALGGSANWLMFFFRWEPGLSSISRARCHRPDLCLPHTGWRQAGESSIRNYFVADKFTLTFGHYRFVHSVPNQPTAYAHAFFCVGEDIVGEDNRNLGGYSLTTDLGGLGSGEGMVEAALHGLRNPGQQILELILVTARPIPNSEAEDHFANLLPRLVSVQHNPAASAASR